jgi:anaerobic dimethyl sulfoxide reductase subunit B (iron-sulfur subunit)
MKKGFIFNHDLCVSCKACSAACLLENRWSVNAREIYSHNSETFLPEPVINLSLACNHCEDPLCLYGCPTSAYYRDPHSEAVIIDSQKCIGCRYCLWNCPYDAPKLNIKKGYIEKCHFCYHRLKEEAEPACTAACPTGALDFGEIPDNGRLNNIKWIPERNINPALHLTGNKETKPLKIIPEIPITEEAGINNPKKAKDISKEWSLILFSFLTTISVAINLADSVTGNSNGSIKLLLIVVLAGVFSLFHLKSRIKAWRTLINILDSPLSREIVLFTVYALLLFAVAIIDSPSVRIITVITGLLLLIALDNVYTYADKSLFMLLHSGQSFLTGLLIASFIMNAVIPFIFIASAKLLFNLIALKKTGNVRLYFAVRFVRIALLIISSIVLITGFEKIIMAGYVVFLAGELLDRIMYYIDFEPLNINITINETLIPYSDEKEGS